MSKDFHGGCSRAHVHSWFLGDRHSSKQKSGLLVRRARWRSRTTPQLLRPSVRQMPPLSLPLTTVSVLFFFAFGPHGRRVCGRLLKVKDPFSVGRVLGSQVLQGLRERLLLGILRKTHWDKEEEEAAVVAATWSANSFKRVTATFRTGIRCAEDSHRHPWKWLIMAKKTGTGLDAGARGPLNSEALHHRPRLREDASENEKNAGPGAYICVGPAAETAREIQLFVIRRS